MKYHQLLITLIGITGIVMFIGGFFALAAGVNSNIGFIIPLGFFLAMFAARKTDDTVAREQVRPI
jgi:uncharacterized membrane protein YgdD (TMEM256/DUF423 family)